MTVFAVAMTSGTLLALAAQMLTGRLGVGLASVWQELVPTDAHAVRSALGWWLIAGAGFAGSFFTGLLMQELAGGRRRLLGLLLMLLLLLLLLLPHLAVSARPPTLPFALGVDLAGFALGMLTAFCGSWFAMPR